MIRCLAVFLLLCLLIGCGASPTPIPDLVSTQVAVERAAAATLTAEAPTATNTPTPTSTFTPTDIATNTHTPTATWTPTATRTPTATPTDTPTAIPSPTPTPRPTKKPRPTATSTPQPELLVTFQDFHYECQNYKPRTQGSPPNQTVQGYRHFQTLMVVTNQTSDKTLEPPWQPERWIVTDGSTEWEETYAWQWKPITGPRYPQPPIGPGGRASWTWLCYPLPPGAWVKAAEFTAWGHTYRAEFSKPNYGEYNYYDCP